MSASSLFVYGSLLVPALRFRIIGREVAAESAHLDGYQRCCIHGEAYPGLRPLVGAGVTGLLLTELRPGELLRLDRYEGAMYERRRVTVAIQASETTGQSSLSQSSLFTYTYVLRPQFSARLGHEPWSLEQFEQKHSAAFVGAWPVPAS